MAKVTFRFEEGEPVVTYATEGERLLEVAQKSNVPIDAPCYRKRIVTVNAAFVL